ncbi:hypothetical protein HF086_014856 [Spodoptera exigua]|uniref:Gamma-interferon inducible lysosomal thiol reductase n=1 Tax=Spodoptera exigua TaxID=7107 RepID=A0A922MKF2_SPOEX|nr:hypothetical protein HF086_014856 [Spodoptera exigua]
MNYYKIVLLQLFIGLAICESTYSGPTDRINTQDSQNGTAEDTTDVTPIKEKVQIKVYYESLCPFSAQFFVSQLKPTMERLGPYLDIHLIPYGHAKTRRVSRGYKFTCQHGIPECFGNTVQACAIDVLRNITRAVSFNACLLQNTSYRSGYQYFISVFHWCGSQDNVDVQTIWRCVHSDHGSILVKRYGDETHALAPSFVPFLTIDDSIIYQDEALTNLLGTVCQLLKPKPKECTL